MSEVLEQKLERALRDVHNLSDEELLSRDSDSMADEITDRFLLEPIELDREDVEVRREKTTFRPTRDFDRSAPPVSGLAVSYFVPFTGSKGLLDCRPSTFTSRYPQAEVRAEELIFIFLTRGPIAETADELTDQLDLVEEYLDWQGPDVEAFNEELDERIRSAVLERIEEAEEAEADLEDLGFSIRSSGTTTEPSPPSSKPSESSGSATGGGWVFDVALSFAGEEREYVEAVATALRDAGVHVFYDDFAQETLWGKDLAEEFERIFGRDSRFVVLFVSKSYLAKAWPNHERQSAIAARVERQEAMVLPVVFDVTRIPGLPSSVSYLRAADYDPSSLAKMILQRLEGDA